MYCKKIIVAAITLAFLSSCSCAQDQLPKNPKDGEVYRDGNGNSWVWNALLMRWALSGGNSEGGTYYYYPSTGRYTNSAGRTVIDPPHYIKKTVNNSSSRKAVFGSTGRSHSVSA